MNIGSYTVSLEEATRFIATKGCTTVVVQLPEGLKLHVQPIIDYLERHTRATILISGDPCFGACDINEGNFTQLQVDCILHLGHTAMPSCSHTVIPTLCLNVLSSCHIEEGLRRIKDLVQGKTIGLATTAQHLPLLKEASAILRDAKAIPLIGRGDRRLSQPGQILGCNFSSAQSIADQVDAFVFLGSGMFHPLGLTLSTKKPVIALDPYTNQVVTQELEQLKDTLLRQRYAAIAKAQQAQVFGIIISLKSGQQRYELATRIYDLLKTHQKKAYFITMDTIQPYLLDAFKGIECFVSTACPRVAIDDMQRYKTPLLTPLELDIALGITAWEDYRFDEILEP
jgi:2-(3-amino-3-carboxypropyl)histidine synthase